MHLRLAMLGLIPEAQGWCVKAFVIRLGAAAHGVTPHILCERDVEVANTAFHDVEFRMRWLKICYKNKNPGQLSHSGVLFGTFRFRDFSRPTLRNALALGYAPVDNRSPAMVR